MTQALFTAMTGLNAGTEQLTVVSDNVANMNTTAYKTSRVDFQDIWYQTTTTGTNSTVNSGGTNPYQVGVGVKCASITKDFGASSINTTGRTSDMALQGDGWFTVVNSDGAVLLTRDGTFSLDENGYLVTANGSKVLGMDQMLSETRCDVPIKFPTSIKVVEEPTPNEDFKDMYIEDLNNAQITEGYFKMSYTKDGVTTYLRVPVGNVKEGDVEDLVNAINGLGTVKAQTSTDGANWTTITGNITDIFKADDADGILTFTPVATNADGSPVTLKFEIGGTDKDITISNFVAQTGLGSATPDANGVYSTKPLSISATITEVDDITSDLTKNYKSYSVGLDGLVTVKYSDGSELSVKANEDGTTYFSYINSEGVIINDDTTNTGDYPLYVDPNVLVKANMQMQFAKVLNNGGLVAVGNNMYEIGVNCGDVLYTAANVNGVGGLFTGALEASNVDLAQQFSNMILAQRLVQANSQVFSGANSILETLVYLGRG